MTAKRFDEARAGGIADVAFTEGRLVWSGIGIGIGVAAALAGAARVGQGLAVGARPASGVAVATAVLFRGSLGRFPRPLPEARGG
jgi:hypothetical protein